MSQKISRRDFVKAAGAGAAAAAVLTGCGPASRYVVREPYTRMPEYSYNGLSTFYATTCRECPAGCGIVVRTMQGRALKVEGSDSHPVNLGKTCARGQASLQGLYNPDRFHGPARYVEDRGFPGIDWDEAVAVVKEALTATLPDGIAFLLGMAPDHLADLVTEITGALGAPAPIRYGAFGMLEGRATLAEAASDLLGSSAVPFFDLGRAEVTFSFGANFLETYLSPVAYARGYSQMRRGPGGRRGTLVQFEPRMSQTAAAADEWVPIAPGTEGPVALALAREAAEIRGGALPAALLNVDTAAIAKAAGIAEGEIRRLAGVFAAAARPLAIPGGAALGTTAGLNAAKAILGLNLLVNNLGQEGGVFLTPGLPVHEANPRLPAAYSDLQNLVDRIEAGKVKVLFVHGANPAFELPASLGFREALARVPSGASAGRVPQVISFASFPDETAALADYILPDHTGLESWGYQKVVTGSDRPAISGSQPVVLPFFDTRATADVLLAAIQAAGGSLAAAVPYKDEVAFLQTSVLELVRQDGFFNAPEIKTFWAGWQQHGGWWSSQPGLSAPVAGAAGSLEAVPAEFEGDGEFYLHVFPSPILGDGSGANKPWLQETPDPTTTVMWNTWVEMHPKTAEELGIQDDDVVRVVSPHGELEASVYRYPAIRPDTIAIPFGQGHTALGRYAEGRGANPAELLGPKVNAAGDLAFASLRVRVEKTGRKKPLARLESRMGVYGEGFEH